MDKLAKSLAGHDKDHVYAVVNEDERDVYLADGRGRTLDKPKRKRRRHVQLITHFPKEYAEILESVRSDSDLIHVQRVYHSAVYGAEQ